MGGVAVCACEARSSDIMRYLPVLGRRVRKHCTGITVPSSAVPNMLYCLYCTWVRTDDQARSEPEAWNLEPSL